MKNNKVLVKIFIIIPLLILTLPIRAKGKTIAEFEAEVNKYTAELREKQNNMAKNDEEAAQISKKIKNIQYQVNQVQKETQNLAEEIEISNKEIAKKGKESKNVIEYYQIANGYNVYLEYIFGATSITDMIYRLSIVEQLTEYNDEVMKELEVLIEKNKARQKQLAKKQDELKKYKKDLEREKSKIEADTESLKHTLPSIEVRIKEAQDNVNYFKKLKCGRNEDIFACQYRIQQESNNSLPSVGTFWRPMKKGYVTQGYGGRYGHRGYDLSSSNKREPIYPIAPGVVFSIYKDNCTTSRWCGQMGYSCNGNAKIVVVKHSYNNGFLYSSYVHLSEFGNIKVGQYVGRDTILGYMGTTGCSTGPHLHLEIGKCHWKSGGGCTSRGYQDRIINPASIIKFPSRWNNR